MIKKIYTFFCCLSFLYVSLYGDVYRAPYGLWETPISSEVATGSSLSRYSQFFVTHDKIYRLEARKGKAVIILHEPGQPEKELTLKDYFPHTKVHEYGGLSFTAEGETIYFINDADQRIYRRTSDENITPLTEPGTRFAELLITQEGIIAVSEEHRNKQVINRLVFIDISNGVQTTLDEGHDFYSSPAVSPDGKQVAWLTWDFPHMPWDSTQLWTAAIDQGKLNNKQLVAGNENESIFQPQWSPKGTLYFVSDRTGWWNLYRFKKNKVENIYPLKAEFGLPQWFLGMSTWAFTGKREEILCTYFQDGNWKLGLLNPASKRMFAIELGYNDYSQIAAGHGFAVMLAASPTIPRRLVKMDLSTFHEEPLGHYNEINFDTGSFSLPIQIKYPSAGGRFAYGHYYAPRNKNYIAPEDTLPPLIVISHGGPTAMADPSFNLKIQYWTTRGFAVLDVNYGGSTGFGRKYRERLKGQWGIVDVEDSVYGAKYLADKGLVDGAKMVIRGASAGGFTTLAALAFTDTFVAGASYAGVADLALLAKNTHKFESRYLDGLIGPLPESKAIYRERSPYYHADQFKSSVIFFHGEKDPVVPVEQAKKMYSALRKQGINTEINIYENEEHNFRQTKHVQDSLEKELKFYLKIFYPIAQEELAYY